MAGTISENSLMHKLVQSKKVMNKVETGSFERGNINEQILKSSPEELIQVDTTQSVGRKQMPVNEDRINNSKLPDAIKKAMIENPIPQISLNDTIDMNMFAGAKKLMEREGMISKPSKSSSSTTTETKISIDSSLISQLTPIIENTIRKVLDEKLNQILSAQQTMSINENLVLKVGDSIFKGKITNVNKSK
jgi:hypothetical protein